MQPLDVSVEVEERKVTTEIYDDDVDGSSVGYNGDNSGIKASYREVYKRDVKTTQLGQKEEKKSGKRKGKLTSKSNSECIAGSDEKEPPISPEVNLLSYIILWVISDLTEGPYDSTVRLGAMYMYLT